MNKRLIDIFEEVEGFHWWFAGRRKILAGVLKKEKNNEGTLKILDVGCGTGNTIKFLQKYGEVWGIDNLPEAVTICRKAGHTKVLPADATKLPFRNKVFDAVAFLDVLEHVEKDSKAIKEARRVLKPGGVVVITVPAIPWIWSKHDSLQGHVRRYRSRHLRQLLQEEGLQVETLKHFNVFLFGPIAAVRILSRLPAFSRLGEYDSRINFDIAKTGPINSILTGVFGLEIWLSRWINFPGGVSLLAVGRKK